MMRLRQIAWAATDLSAAERAVETTLGLERCFRDPGVATFGLHNALFPIGDQFLEIVSPLPDVIDTAAGRHLAKHGDEAGYMVILQTDDVEAVRQRASEHDVRLVFEAEGGDEVAGTSIRGLHFHPKDVGGAILSVDQSQRASEWAWAGPSWRDHVRTDVSRALTSVTIDVPDPSATASTWASLLGCESDGSRLDLDDATIEFVAGAGRGVVGIGVRPALEDQAGTLVPLLGTTIRFE